MIGIYKITNKINGRVYIGQSKSIGTRWNNHLNRLECGKHDNKDLQNDYNYFGYNTFIFEIVEECTEIETLKLEKQYIEEYSKNCYNIINNIKRSFCKYNNNIFINSNIYNKYNKNISKLAQHIILLAYKYLDENNYIELSVTECSNKFGITKECICKNKDKIVNDLLQSNIFEYVEYKDNLFVMSFNEQYLKIDLEIPYYDFYYSNISNYNTVKFIIYIILYKDITITVEEFKELFGINNDRSYKYLKEDYISKILKDLNNINIKVNFKEIKSSRKISKLHFDIQY